MKKMSKKQREEFERIKSEEKKATEQMLSLNFDDFKKEAVSTFCGVFDSMGDIINWTADERDKVIKGIGELHRKEQAETEEVLKAMMKRIKCLEQLLYMTNIALISKDGPPTDEAKRFFADLLHVDLKGMSAAFQKQARG